VGEGEYGASYFFLVLQSAKSLKSISLRRAPDGFR